jgi:hypothetical protein
MKNLQPSPHKADPPKFLPKEHRAQLTVYQSSNDPPADPIYHQRWSDRISFTRRAVCCENSHARFKPLMRQDDSFSATFPAATQDKRHRVISYQKMFQGTIEGASVHPREVVKEALKQNAAAVILALRRPTVSGS